MVIKRFRARTVVLLSPVRVWLPLAIGILILLAAPGAWAAPSVAGDWQRIPVRYSQRARFCIDYHNPHSVAVIMASEFVQHTYNWQTDQNNLMQSMEESERAMASCAVSGLYFSGLGNSVGEIWRTSLDDSTRRRIERYPTLIAQDGSQQVYSQRSGEEFWASADGGLTWVDRSAQLPAKNAVILLADANARMLYAFGNGSADSAAGPYRLYASQDAGASWELRYTTGLGRAKLLLPKGRNTPATTLILYHNDAVFVSSDGGKTFVEQLGLNTQTSDVYFAHSLEGLIRSDNQENGPTNLALSRDGGATWAPLATLPAAPKLISLWGDRWEPLETAPSAPQTVIYNHGDQHGYSLDGGRTWQIVTDIPELRDLQVTPYLPLTLIAVQYTGKPNPSAGVEITHDLLIKPIPVEAAALTVPGVPSGSPRDRFFPAKGHAMDAAFIDAWERNGGLAQFGYPLTEDLREISPTDGRIYTVQYFERNRFEHHPEHQGTPDVVQLGLLGSQLTAGRRGEPAFLPQADDTSNQHCTFYPATRHRLCHAFQGYWNANGGLAIYGYPISDEFVEDGLIVQYFERARFEWHPEHQGTPYAVQLGLLGDELLRTKTWDQ
jgi:hypothetical protein